MVAAAATPGPAGVYSPAFINLAADSLCSWQKNITDGHIVVL